MTEKPPEWTRPFDAVRVGDRWAVPFGSLGSALTAAKYMQEWPGVFLHVESVDEFHCVMEDQ